jgi:probable O-glycosylation ligase (exosortase A-associated)
VRDLYIALVYFSFIVFGVSAPFVATLGYMWTDTFYPQLISDYVAMIPSSMLMGAMALLLYLARDRRQPAQFTIHTLLTICFALWCLMTLAWAEVPVQAAEKADWAVKTVLFSAFIPIVIRSRVQIEAFVQVYLFAVLIHMLPVGTKTFLSGSAYGRDLGIIKGNVGLAESSALASISIAMIPIILYLRSHAILIPKSRWTQIGYSALAFLAIPAAIGTYARTALVGFGVVGVFMFMQSRRKVLYVAVCAALVIGFALKTSDTWSERIETTANYDEENSALGRILVWQWTLGYVADHPLGGGFNSYMINSIVMPSNGSFVVVHGKAFHNMYFEVLGEQGFPGLIMFLSVQGLSLLYLFRIIRRTRGQEHLLWLYDLARALMTALLTIMACGCFIGIGFQAYVWYLIALPVCLREYLRRVDALEGVPLGARRPGGGLPGKFVPAGAQQR